MLNRGMATELKVGIFTAVGLSSLAVATMVLDGNPFAPKAQQFYTVLDNVAGVAPRTGVRVSGVQIGEVSSVELLPKGAKVNFTVDPKVQIPKGSYIELRSRGILGDVFLEVVRSENSTDNLKSGDLIPKIKEQNDLNSLMSSIGSIAKNIQNVSHTLDVVLGNEEGQTSLKNIIQNIERITSDSRDLVAGERKNISDAIRGMKEVAQRLANVVDRNDDRIDAVLSSIDSASRDFKVFAAELRNAVGGANKGKLETILASLDDSMRNIRDASDKVRLVADKVQKGEGTIGALLSKDDTINELNSTLKEVKEFMRPATSLKVEVDYKGEYHGKQTASHVGTLGNHFNVRLKTRPDRFYLLGVSDSPMARRVTETTVTPQTQNGVTSTRVETRESDNRGQVRFNAQFAKRFNAIALRLGIFESYGGVAGDIYLLSDRLTASVEVSGRRDPADKGFANVKGYSNVFVTENVYFTGGVDSANNYAAKNATNKPLPFVGAGLRFTDDDLRAVIGAAAIAK